MRSSWSAERVLALLAAASLEGAWLTLAYVMVQWYFAAHRLHLGIGELALGAGAGLLLARRLRHLPRRAFAAALMGAAMLAGVAGVWLAVAPGLAPADLAAALARHPGGWLLGIAVLRGSAHGDPDDEGFVTEKVLGRGAVWLVAFWIIASLSTLSHAVEVAGPAFAATITFVSAGLLAVGLARLAELRVEATDGKARRRWIGLLVGVSILLLAIGTPLSVLLGVPVQTALVALGGPLAPLVGALVVVLATPIGWLLGGLAVLMRAVGDALGFGRQPPPSGPSMHASASAQALAHGAAPDLGWLVWLLVLLGAVLLVWGVAALLRRPLVAPSRTGGDEVREAEPIVLSLLPPLPRLRRPRRRRGSPRTAEEAYRWALEALAGRPEERRRGETPREHAARLASTAIGPSIGRLAVDYQLSALAGRRLTPGEERRAILRWRSVVRARAEPSTRKRRASTARLW